MKIKFDNEKSYIYIEKGKFYLERKEYKKSEIEFKKVIRTNPESREAHFELGKIYYIQKKIPEAIEELKTAIKIDNKNKHIHLLLGKAYILQEKFSLAVKEYKKTQELGYDKWEIYRELGHVYQKKGEYGLSRKSLKKAIELNPEDGKIHADMGRIYLYEKKYELAIKEFKEAIKKGIDDEDIHTDLGNAYYRKGEYEFAIKEFKEAIKKGIDDEDIHSDLGKAYYQKGEYELAIDEFKKTLQLNPENGDAHAGLGKVYELLGDYDLAIKECKESLKKGYDVKAAKISLSNLYYKQIAIKVWDQRKDNLNRIYKQEKKKYELNIAEIKESIKKGFETYKTHIKLGRLYREIGKYDLSIEEFEKAYELSLYKDNTFFKNAILNEIEISQGKTILKSKPRQIQITLTNRCNLKCKMCIEWERTPWDFSQERVKEVIDYLPYLQEIYWGPAAGEVFLSKYFEELFENASTYPQLRQIIVTNGLLIDEKWAEKLARRNVVITYSIDGATKKTYEYIRKGAKYEDLLRSINVVNKYKEEHNKSISSPADKMRTEINFVMMKSNYQEIENMLDFAKEYKFDVVKFFPIEGTLTQENIFLHQDLNAINYIRELKPKLLKKAREYKIHLEIILPKTEVFNSCEFEFNGGEKVDPVRCSLSNGVRKKTVKILNKEKKRKGVISNRIETNNNPGHSFTVPVLCYQPWQNLYIGWGKNVRPHCLCRVDIGNIEENSLEEIWNGKAMQRYRKKLLNNCLNWCNYKCISDIMPQNMLKFTRFGSDGE